MMSLIMNINDASNGIDDHITNDYELRVKLGHPKCTSTSLLLINSVVIRYKVPVNKKIVDH
jgi:hypothetical protein